MRLRLMLAGVALVVAACGASKSARTTETPLASEPTVTVVAGSQRITLTDAAGLGREVSVDRNLLFNSARLAREMVYAADHGVTIQLFAYSSNANAPTALSQAGPGERTVSFGILIDLDTVGTIDEKTFAVVGCSGATYPIREIADASRMGSRTLAYGFFTMPSVDDVCKLVYDHAGTHIGFIFTP